MDFNCGETTGDKLVFWRNQSSESVSRASFASIHRIISWLDKERALIASARSARHCLRGLGVVDPGQDSAMTAACLLEDVRGPELVVLASGTL